jgi:hypothetical protein
MQRQTFSGLSVDRGVLKTFPQHIGERDNIKNNQKYEKRRKQEQRTRIARPETIPRFRKERRCGTLFHQLSRF